MGSLSRVALPWRGVAIQPYLILEPYPDNLTLIFNQFGDTNVAYYRIYGGTSPHPTTLLAESGTTLKTAIEPAEWILLFPRYRCE